MPWLGWRRAFVLGVAAFVVMAAGAPAPAHADDAPKIALDARADDPPKVALDARPAPSPSPSPSPSGIWPLAGAATALVPMAVGGALFTQEGHRDRQHLGVSLMAVGFFAAPLIAHVGSGRGGRALVFGLASLMTSAGAVIAMSANDPFGPVTRGRDRVPFNVLMTTALLAAAAGVIDGFLVEPDGTMARW